MNIDVGKAIKELLFEQPSVIVPGLGGFTTAPQAATVDYVQGVVSPPSRKIDFNPNLVINDGLLVNHIQKSANATFQEAKESVELYVTTMNDALERREIVEIGSVGRLYKDYEHKIRYMPEGANFNLDAFGMPSIQFTPVTRERPAVAASEGQSSLTSLAPVMTPDSTDGSEPAPDVFVTHGLPEKKWVQSMLPWLILLAAVILAVSIYLMFSDANKPVADNLPADKERVNVKPGTEEADATTDAESDAANAPAEDDPPQAPTAAEDSPAKPAPAEKEAAEVPEKKATVPSGSASTLIIIHSFGVKENARKFAQQLDAGGYTAETQHIGTLYRVGVRLASADPKEIANKISELGKKFKSSPKTEKELDEQ